MVGFVNIGFGNIVSAERIVAMISPDSAPIKRLVQNAKDTGMAIDATQGRRTRQCLLWMTDTSFYLPFCQKPYQAAGKHIIVMPDDRQNCSREGTVTAGYLSGREESR